MGNTNTVDRLRLCSDILADTDSWDQFFPAIQVTRQVIEELLPKPYVGSPVPLPPAELFNLVDQLNKLELCKITIPEFCKDTLDTFISKLDDAIYKALSVTKFNACLGELLQSLATRESIKNDESGNVRSHAQESVDNSTTSLWIVFSALPETEKEHLLPPPPTKAK